MKHVTKTALMMAVLALALAAAAWMLFGAAAGLLVGIVIALIGGGLAISEALSPSEGEQIQEIKVGMISLDGDESAELPDEVRGMLLDFVRKVEIGELPPAGSFTITPDGKIENFRPGEEPKLSDAEMSELMEKWHE